MRTLAATLLFLIALGHSALHAQTLNASSYIEKTHVSPKVGSTLGVMFNNQFEVGGFYQQSTIELQAEYGRPLTSEKLFYGLYVTCPLKSYDKLGLNLNIRTGVSNNENFVITPSMQANVHPWKKVAISGAIGTRALRPTWIAGIKFML
jgi:hypothetical protein